VLGEKCVRGAALYCALEDNERRMQRRCTRIFDKPGQFGYRWPDYLHVCYEMPRLKEGGIEYVANWLEKMSKGKYPPRIVVIDTLVAVRSPKQRDQSAYEADYHSVKELFTLAHVYHVAIVLVHHLRKGEGEETEPVDMLSGTLGLPGAVDLAMVIHRTAKHGLVLSGRGRDVDYYDKQIALDPKTQLWKVLGDVGEDVSKGEKAEQFLRGALSNGRVESGILRRMAEAEGISQATLYRVRKVVGVKQIAGFKKTFWQLED